MTLQISVTERLPEEFRRCVKTKGSVSDGRCGGGPHITSAYFKGRVFSAQGAGGHYIVIVPYLDFVVVHRVNTDIQGRQVTSSQFGHLMQLILDARM
jgi:hypothetical protein